MNYVSAENLSKSYGIKTLFENISFNINEGDKIAIVAKNGSGKSTLLKIIFGTMTAENKFVRVGTKVIKKRVIDCRLLSRKAFPEVHQKDRTPPARQRG